MRFARSAGAVVFCKNACEKKFLLLHYSKGHWGFPKGHIEEGEKEKQAALREKKEETALSVRLIDGFRERISYSFRENGEVENKTVSFYLAEAPLMDVVLSPEHTEFQWLSFSDALKRLSFDNTKRVLKKANSFLSSKNKPKNK